MRLTSKIFIDSRYTKANGTQAIKIRVTINRKSIEFATGITIEPKYWNSNKMEIKPACPSIKNITRANNALRKQRLDIEDKIMGFEHSGHLSSMSLKSLKSAISGEDHNDGILSYSTKIIDELTDSKRFGNARVYRTLFRSIRDFQNGKEIPLISINFSWLKAYEAWYLGKGNTKNGLSVHMRTLRALINRAIAEGLLKKDNYPFDKYTIKVEKTKKRAISEIDIQKIKAYVPNSPQKERAKDFFLSSFYLMGCSFVDLAFMQVNQIQDGRIEYKRKKTGQLHSIKITPPLQAILDKYIGKKQPNDFVFNIITSQNEEKQYNQVRDELRRYNKRMKAIGQECEISGSVTSYVARHSFATIAKFKGVPISVISQSLGHSDSKVTEVYMAEFSNETMDGYNDMVLDV